MLAVEIARRYPGVRAEGLAAAIEDTLDVGAIDPKGCDLVLSATGDPNVDRALHERLFRAPERPPLLFTWLEPLGLGGHAVVIQPASVRATGCLDCLFTAHPLDPAPALANRTAFAAPGQVFTRELAGCGNAFTPYSSLDAMRTAELAARLAVAVLGGEEHQTILRSWRGTGEVFRAAGYRTSARFDLDADALERGCTDLAVPGCDVCGSR